MAGLSIQKFFEMMFEKSLEDILLKYAINITVRMKKRKKIKSYAILNEIKFCTFLQSVYEVLF
jgi:hypothetical protein